MYDKRFGFSDLPFNVTPDARFLYNSPLYQEAFAVLRYGIEARKGFIVITGDAGTGKTMLLRMLMESVATNVHAAVIFNPRLNFAELLRFILNDLGIPHSTDDRITMMRQLNDYLIEQYRRDDIVAVLIDEAQGLSDEMLEELRLLSNLETREEKLIQIVLMGQPELERRLDQPGLRQLKQRVSLCCRLLPLRDKEVGPYIASRLHAVGYEGNELFAPEAVERVACYSEGIPRLINVICDNALLLAYAASEAQISGAMVEKVACDLQFKASPKGEKNAPTTVVAITGRWRQGSSNKTGEEKATIASRDADVVGSKETVTFAEVAICGPATSAWLTVRNLVGLVILVGAGALLYFQQSRDYLAGLAANRQYAAGTRAEGLKQAKLLPLAVAQEEISDGPSRLQAPVPQGYGLRTRDLNEAIALVPDTSTLAEAHVAEKAIPNKRGEHRDKITTAAQSVIASRVSSKLAPSRKLASQIYKAINNRAIEGVKVSVINDTVSLAGQVATERQRAAAVLAARSVPGVKDVRDQIIVDSGVFPAVPP